MNRFKRILGLLLILGMLVTEIPMYASAASSDASQISDFQVFLKNLTVLEEYAEDYYTANPGKNPVALAIQYIRTGEQNFTGGIWNTIAGNTDSKFAAYVLNRQETYNATVSATKQVNVTGLKNLGLMKVPNGDIVDMGHVFAVMDATYYSNGNESYGDVAGWAGDLVDLLTLADKKGVKGDLEQMVQKIAENYFLQDGTGAAFSRAEFIGDLDGYAIATKLMAAEQADGMLSSTVKAYFSKSLTGEQRADFFLKNRMGARTNRSDIREAVFSSYTRNAMVASLESNRTFTQADVSDLRKACCYAFADYLCELAGDYVQWGENTYLTVTESEKTTLTPGITLETVVAETSDDKRVVYYVATADVSNPYVNVYVNYKNNDPSKGWGMSAASEQAQAAEDRHSNPKTENYIPNYNVIAAINGAGYTMSTGEPRGLLMMEGVEYHAPDGEDHNGYGFFGILKDGSAIIGSTKEYYELKKQGLLMEGIDNFGYTLVKNGQKVPSSSDPTDNRHARTAVGITKTGKVVFMVVDGRQEPYSIGASTSEMAQIMLDAGCVDAINLDGGGSSTMLTQKPGDQDVSLTNKPTEGFERTVSTSLIMVSTYPAAGEMDHAVLNSETEYLTVGSKVQMTASGVNFNGEEVALPAGTSWAVSSKSIATISKNGVLTGVANGQVEVRLMLNGKVVGKKTMHVVVPDAVYFTSDSMNAVYGQAVTLPVAASYQGKPVAIQEKDVSFVLSNTAAGSINGMTFTGSKSANVKNVQIQVSAVNNPAAKTGTMRIALRKDGETYFDFENANGGSYHFAWNRVVTNATTADNVLYNIVDTKKSMVTEYTFGIDMSQIAIPEALSDQIFSNLGIQKDAENAWELVTGLADRISSRTEVKTVIKFDKNFNVDYSALSVKNDVFTLKSVDLNTSTNELTLSIGWKEQSKALDPGAVSPICILSGIKLTPKSKASWNADGRLAVENTGEVRFEIYVRGDALYSAAQNSGNKLNPFTGSGEKGASFVATNVEFYDAYTLKNSQKSGWIYENGGYAYYENGKKYTGIRKVGQFYYDFGEDGINVGQTRYSGIFEENGKNYYAKDGALTSGWIVVGTERYYFDENGAGYQGEVVIDEVIMTFDNGRLVGGYTGFVKKADGKTYHYTNGTLTLGWYNDGEYWYYFHTQNGVMITGTGVTAHDPHTRYDFAKDGKLLRGYFNSTGYYFWVGEKLPNSWVKPGDDPESWYLTNGDGHFVTDPTGRYTEKMKIDGVTYTVVKIPYEGVTYTFDNTNGKLLLGSVTQKNDKLYYYWAGNPVKNSWIELEGNKYYAFSDGHLATGAVTIEGKPYMFSAQGALIEGGTQVQVALAEGNRTMTVKLVNADATMTSAKVAVWARNVGQTTLQWFSLEKRERSGSTWVVEIPMCPFGVTKTDSFELHFYGVVNGVESMVTATSVDHLTPAEHNYESQYDYKCDACGVERSVNMERPMMNMYRMYDPNSGEHFYTGSVEERDYLVIVGWQYEGIGFTFPLTTGKPVHRLYDPATGEHLYTMDENEKAMLMAAGWNYEGVAFNSGFENEVPQYRLHNPNATRGAYHFTASVAERDYLISLGWEYQGIGWYSLGAI